MLPFMNRQYLRRMRLLIVAATGFEIKPFVRNFAKTREKLVSGAHVALIKNKKIQVDMDTTSFWD